MAGLVGECGGSQVSVVIGGSDGGAAKRFGASRIDFSPAVSPLARGTLCNLNFITKSIKTKSMGNNKKLIFSSLDIVYLSAL